MRLPGSPYARSWLAPWYLEICWPTKWTEPQRRWLRRIFDKKQSIRGGKGKKLNFWAARRTRAGIRSIYYRLNYHNTLYRWLASLASAAENAIPPVRRSTFFSDCDCVSETDEALMFKLTVKFSFALVDPPTRCSSFSWRRRFCHWSWWQSAVFLGVGERSKLANRNHAEKALECRESRATATATPSQLKLEDAINGCNRVD